MSTGELKSLAFRRERSAGWIELEKLVDHYERRGAAALSPKELSRLPGLYRAAVSSLSVARTISLDRNVVEYLDALCVRAFGCVYSSRRGLLEALGDLVVRRIPSVVRSRRTAVLLATLALALGVAVGWATTSADPERFYAYVPEGLAGDRGPHASTERLREALYVRESSAPTLSVFAAFLFTHNASIGILSFVLGMLAGLPTGLLVFNNGLVLGAFVSLYTSRGLGLEVWAWLLPHGVPELTALLLCGAAGFSLAEGMLLPGRLSRRESLSARGREAGILVVGAVLLDLAAGILEGVVRQVVLHPAARLSIAVAVAGALVAWLGLGGRGRAR
jgi:uncharacterized membrane protein SpoIIM required for sporulation